MFTCSEPGVGHVTSLERQLHDEPYLNIKHKASWIWFCDSISTFFISSTFAFYRIFHENVISLVTVQPPMSKTWQC